MTEVKMLTGEIVDVIEWQGSVAVPHGVAIIVANNAVVWCGPAHKIPDTLPWPGRITVNLDPTTHKVVAEKAKSLEKGIPVVRT